MATSRDIDIRDMMQQTIDTLAEENERLSAEVRSAFYAGAKAYKVASGQSRENQIVIADLWGDYSRASDRRDIGQEIVDGLKEHAAVDERDPSMPMSGTWVDNDDLDEGKRAADRRADEGRDRADPGQK